MKEIVVNSRRWGQRIAYVDDEDYEIISKFSWHVESSGKIFYAANKKQKRTAMHRLIMKVNDPKIEVDHINGNGLDNQKKNLRLCNRKQNGKNIGLRKNNRTSYKGVSINKEKNKWRVRITVDGKELSLGQYKNITDAAKAYDEAAKKYHGEFARLNFPNGA